MALEKIRKRNRETFDVIMLRTETRELAREQEHLRIKAGERRLGSWEYCRYLAVIGLLEKNLLELGKVCGADNFRTPPLRVANG